MGSSGGGGACAACGELARISVECNRAFGGVRAGSRAEWGAKEVSVGRWESCAWLAFRLESKVLRSGARKGRAHGQAAIAQCRVTGGHRES